MKTLVFGNLFKLFRLASTFAREVYHLGVKMKTNMTIVLFFSLCPTANCPCECDGKFKSVNKLPNTGVFTALLSGRCGHLQKLQNKRVTSLMKNSFISVERGFKMGGGGEGGNGTYVE